MSSTSVFFYMQASFSMDWLSVPATWLLGRSKIITCYFLKDLCEGQTLVGPVGQKA